MSVEGFRVLAECLYHHGARYMFGVVGVPVVEVALTAQQCGIQYVGMRNEQSACYAAQAVGYLTGHPGVCLVVSGPGLLHALGGMANAKENSWPLVVIGGSSDTDQEGRGAFQEWPQVESCRLYAKYVARPNSLEHLPVIVERAIRTSIYGRPGPVYIDMPGDLLRATISDSEKCFLPQIIPEPKCIPPESEIQKAASKSPLVIVGKGSAYGRAENAVRKLVNKANLPFLPTPMGKGVVPDDHPSCVASARSMALQEADVILVIGARLNWILHFGLPPRFDSKVKIVQIDICPEELGNSRSLDVCLWGDIGLTVSQITETMKGWQFCQHQSWWQTLREKCRQNKDANKELAEDHSVPLSYYAVFGEIQKKIPIDAMIISEGANTMDIGRGFLSNGLPRRRLDAGSFGTMGVGLGFAIAASLVLKDISPETRIFCIEGDSAFGFSGMEIETIVRYGLPITVMVINNNGIYGGLDEELFKDITGGSQKSLLVPPTALTPTIRYERLMSLFGLEEDSYFCTSIPEISEALDKCLNNDKGPNFVNIMINPMATRKAQTYEWLTRSKM